MMANDVIVKICKDINIDGEIWAFNANCVLSSEAPTSDLID
jgi:hypothetical protein